LGEQRVLAILRFFAFLLCIFAKEKNVGKKEKIIDYEKDSFFDRSRSLCRKWNQNFSFR
jgi:hypothetical protein